MQIQEKCLSPKHFTVQYYCLIILKLFKYGFLHLTSDSMLIITKNANIRTLYMYGIQHPRVVKLEKCTSRRLLTYFACDGSFSRE